MEMLRFYDFDNREIVMIPATNLPPGSMQVRVEGIEEPVWVRAEKLKLGTYKHPPFAEPLRGCIQRIQRAFAEHCPLNYEDWEDGFRRDQDPDQEIAIVLRAAEIYCEFVSRWRLTLDERRDAFGVVSACMNTTHDQVWLAISLSALSQGHAESIVARYYNLQV